MYAKLLFMCWRVAMQPSTLLTGLGMPLAFSLISQSFQGPALAGTLILYIVYAFSATMDSQAVLRFSLVQLPVSTRQVVISSFLYQLTVALAAWLMAAAFALAMRFEISLLVLARIALLSLLIGGISRALGFRMPANRSALINVLLFIPMLAFGVAGPEMLLLAFLSLPVHTLVTLGGFLMAMSLSIRFQPTMREVGA